MDYSLEAIEVIHPSQDSIYSKKLQDIAVKILTLFLLYNIIKKEKMYEEEKIWTQSIYERKEWFYANHKQIR